MIDSRKWWTPHGVAIIDWLQGTIMVRRSMSMCRSRESLWLYTYRCHTCRMRVRSSREGTRWARRGKRRRQRLKIDFFFSSTSPSLPTGSSCHPSYCEAWSFLHQFQKRCYNFYFLNPTVSGTHLSTEKQERSTVAKNSHSVCMLCQFVIKKSDQFTSFLCEFLDCVYICSPGCCLKFP